MVAKPRSTRLDRPTQIGRWRKISTTKATKDKCGKGDISTVRKTANNKAVTKTIWGRWGDDQRSDKDDREKGHDKKTSMTTKENRAKNLQRRARKVRLHMEADEGAQVDNDDKKN
jgi:hypothetical protein